MKNDEVLIDMQNFPDKERLMGVKPIFDRIEQTISQNNEDVTNCACIAIHVDPAVNGSEVSTFMYGSPKMNQQLLCKAMCVAIKQSAKPGKEGTLILLNVMRLLTEVDVENLDLDSIQKLALSKAFANIGVIALNC